MRIPFIHSGSLATLRSAQKYAGNLYALFRGIIGSAPVYGVIVLGLRLAHKILMVAGFMVGLKFISGRFDNLFGASFDVAFIPEAGHLVFILAVSAIFLLAILAQYLDLSLKTRIVTRYARFVRTKQTESIFDYAESNRLTAEKTAEILAEYSKKYAVVSVRRLATVAELMLMACQAALSAFAFLVIIILLAPGFGILLFAGAAIVVLYSIKKDYSRKILAQRKHDSSDNQAKNKNIFLTQELELLLRSKGFGAVRNQLLTGISIDMLLRQLDAKKMKNSIRVLGTVMLSITVIAFLCFFSFGGIDMNRVPWVLVILIYFALRNAMADTRTVLQGITTMNLHYEAVTAFLDMQQRKLDWSTELKRTGNLGSVEDLSVEAE